MRIFKETFYELRSAWKWLWS